MSLSTHVLDTARGRPAAGVHVICEHHGDGGWQRIAEAVTDHDGRIGDLVDRGNLATGSYRLTFATGDWATANGTVMFWPEVTIAFTVTAADEHHHVPLLLSPFGYSTYRGS